MRRGDGEFGVKPLRTYASSFILSLAFATALVLPWAVSRRLRPVAAGVGLSLAARRRGKKAATEAENETETEVKNETKAEAENRAENENGNE